MESSYKVLCAGLKVSCFVMFMAAVGPGLCTSSKTWTASMQSPPPSGGYGRQTGLSVDLGSLLLWVFNTSGQLEAKPRAIGRSSSPATFVW